MSDEGAMGHLYLGI